MGALTNFIKAAATVLPEIRKPTRKPSLNEKLDWNSSHSLYGHGCNASDWNSCRCSKSILLFEYHICLSTRHIDDSWHRSNSNRWTDTAASCWFRDYQSRFPKS